MRQRFPDAGAKTWDTVLLVFGVFPTTFFLRMTYTESMFMFLTILALYGMERRWSLLTIALICGLATATRPVGVALLAPFLYHIGTRGESLLERLSQACLLLPIATWGLLAYMAYQQAAFGEPLAFAKTQDFWTVVPLEKLTSKPVALLTLDPITGLYDPDSPRYWLRHERHGMPWFSLIWANPLFYLLCLGLLVGGRIVRICTNLELLLGLCLLGIPYLTRAHEMSMMAFARFTAIVFPQYVVLGSLLERSQSSSCAFTAVGAAFLFLYAALYAANYPLI
jgi:hypothetical protein